jgi:hypothetical protein
VSEFPDVFP